MAGRFVRAASEGCSTLDSWSRFGDVVKDVQIGAANYAGPQQRLESFRP